MNFTNFIKSRCNGLFPSEHQLMVKKWYADGGDYELRFNYDLQEKSIVLDVGGYQGQWASDLYSRYNCKIFIFEPVSLFAEKLNKRFEKNTSITVFPFGLGGSSRIEQINVSEDGSSIFGFSDTCEKIMIVDIQEWISQNKIEEISLIKINIEGGEYELLERIIETNLIKNIDNIQVQFHNILDTSRRQMNEIQAKLEKTHKLTYQYEFVWENWTLDNK